MIKHTESQPVAFADCGYARYPEIPVTGDMITIDCLTDAGIRPVLTVTAGGQRVTYAGEQTDGTHTRFRIGPYTESQTIRYFFEGGEEKTGEYRMDVVTEEEITRSRTTTKETDGVSVWLAEDLCCRIRCGETLSMIFRQIDHQNPARTDAGAPAACDVGNDVTVGADPSCVFSVRREKETLALTSLTVWRTCTGRIVKIRQKYRTDAAHVFGTGERFDAVDQQGGQTNGTVTEHFTHQKDQTYLPVPFFMTERGWGYFCAGGIPVELAFQSGTVTMTRETEGETLAEDHLLFGQPGDQLRRYAALTGNPELPPEWAFGVWISGNGWNTDAEVDAQLRALREHQYPATVMVLEQWSDERTFHIWHDRRFPDPAATVRRIRDAGLHLLLWQIPVVKHEWDGEPGAALTEETAEAIRCHYAVEYPDGTPYRITERWFDHSLLPDFTDPETCRWWFGKRRYLLDMGVEGFKTDGGEFLFDKNVRLRDGTSGRAARNLYPVQYEKAYQRFLKENGVNGVLFSRAGYAGAQTVPIHWAGDQTSEWSELQAQLTAGISAGLSGVLFWSFDIGGFAGAIPTPELYLRATAFGCFAPVMQWHSEPRNGQFSGGKGEMYNNDRSPWNLAEKWQRADILELGCYFAEIRAKLRPYLWQEARHCVETGRPMMAHPVIDFPEDPAAWAIRDEYMLGRDLLVAPVIREGETVRTVYLPEGQWTDFFTGRTYTGRQTIERSCGLNEIPVFRRERTCGT